MAQSFDTARLHLRPLRVDDAEALHEGYRDAAAMQWWSSAAHADLAETRAYLLRSTGEADRRGWAVTLAGSDRAIGTLYAGKRRDAVSEIGYFLLPAHQGHGYAREAVAGLLDKLFGEEGHRRVFADTDPDNARSNALLGTLGFTVEGRLRAEWETHIGVRDSLIWGLLADEWARRAGPAGPAARDAYAQELRAVARPVRWLGVALAFVALGVALARRWAPQLPVAVPVFLLVVAVLHIAASVLLRARHRQRHRA